MQEKKNRKYKKKSVLIMQRACNVLSTNMMLLLSPSYLIRDTNN